MAPNLQSRKGVPLGPRQPMQYKPSKIAISTKLAPLPWPEVEPYFLAMLDLSYPAGTRGDYNHTVPVLAENADGSKVTLHNYGAGDEMECNCPTFEPARPCAHVAAVQAKLVPAVAMEAWTADDILRREA